MPYSTFLQVADAVDDNRMDGWVHIAADALKKHAFSVCPKELKHEILQGLSVLSEPLRHRVLVAAVFDPLQLDRLLCFFPAGLHLELLASITTQEKMLQIPLTSRSCPALALLASMPSSPPSVLALQVDNESADQREKKIGHAVWRGLKQVLRHHSGLTRLLLSLSPSTATFSESNLLPHIANLTSLRCLDLKGCILHQDSVVSLPATLRALLQLHSLTLRLSEKVETSCQKRQRDGEAQPSHCLANTLAAAKGLTSLEVDVEQLISPRHKGCFIAAAPLLLPQLVQLTAVFDRSHRGYSKCGIQDDVRLAAQFLSSLTAPLTSLILGEEGEQDPPHIPAADAADAARLVRSLGTFTHLRQLSVVLPKDELGYYSIFDALISALPGLTPTLRRLHGISVSAGCSVLQHVVPLLTSTMLTQLRLCRVDAYRTRPDLFQRVCQLNLRDLSLHFFGVLDNDGVRGLACLTALTQLTALCLSGLDDDGCLDDWRELAAMTGLQALCLGGTDDAIPLPLPSLSSVHALSALTSLTLLAFQEVADVVMQGLAAQPLPALQELKVALYEPFNTIDELARYVAALPALRRLTLLLCYSDPELEPCSSCSDDGLGASLQVPAEARLRSAKECITAAAAAAGVELTIGGHYGNT